jgi:hypothetical protein
VYKVVLHRISTGDSLVVASCLNLDYADRIRDDLESDLATWVVSGVLSVYILPVDANRR